MSVADISRNNDNDGTITGSNPATAAAAGEEGFFCLVSLIELQAVTQKVIYFYSYLESVNPSV